MTPRTRAGALLLALFLGLALPLAGTARAAAPSSGPTTTGRPPAGHDVIRADAAPERAAAKVAPTAVTGTAPPSGPSTYLTTTISTISPTVVTAVSGNQLTVVGTVTNTWTDKIYDIKYQFRRGSALATVKAIKTEIATPAAAGNVGPGSWTRLGPTATTPTAAIDLAPGASMSFVATVELTSTTGLSITTPGVYPVDLQVEADIGQNGNVDVMTVGAMHLLTTVLAVPTVTIGTGSPPATTAPGSVRFTPNALNMLWPLVDTPHVGVQGVFLDDNLAKLISPGGRLYKVLAGLGQADVGPQSTTVVVDPELLDEISQMSDGYLVAKAKGASQPALTAVSTTATTSAAVSGSAGVTSGASSPTTATPTSTSGSTSGTAAPSTTGTTTAPAPPIQTPTVPGTGQAAAVKFLATLRAAVAHRQVLVLPYSDPDAVAMVRAGLGSRLTALITKGRTVAASVLGIGPAVGRGPGLVTTMSAPEGGYVDQPTLDFLSANGLSGSVLTPRTLTHAGGAVGAVSISTVGGTRKVQAAVSDADLLTMANDVVAKGSSAGLSVRLTTLAALLTGASLDGTGTPIVMSPVNRWNPDMTGLQILTGLLRTLAGGDVVAGTPLPTIAAGGTSAATLAYPDSVRRSELDPGYLDRWMRADADLTGLTRSLSKAKGLDTPDPSTQLSPLVTAMTPLLSASLRGGRGVTRQILDTTISTIESLRGQVQITGTDKTTYTLAASTSPLLLTVRNDTPYVVRIRVHITKAQNVGMTATDPGVLSIAAGRSQQFRIDSTVVKAGKFIVDAQLVAADGSNWGEPKIITVQSSAYGTLTLVIIAVAGGALFLMVVIRLVGRIRGRNRDASGRPGNLDAARTSTDDPVKTPAVTDTDPDRPPPSDDSANGENER